MNDTSARQHPFKCQKVQVRPPMCRDHIPSRSGGAYLAVADSYMDQESRGRTMHQQRHNLHSIILEAFQNNAVASRFLSDCGYDSGNWGAKMEERLHRYLNIAWEEYSWHMANTLVEWGYDTDFLVSLAFTRFIPRHARLRAATLLGWDSPASDMASPSEPVTTPTAKPVTTPVTTPIASTRRMKRRQAKKIISRIVKGGSTHVKGYDGAPGNHPRLLRYEAQRARQRAQLATVPRRLGVEVFKRMGRSPAWWDHFVAVWTAPMTDPPYPPWRGMYYRGALDQKQQ